MRSDLATAGGPRSQGSEIRLYSGRCPAEWQATTQQPTLFAAGASKDEATQGEWGRWRRKMVGKWIGRADWKPNVVVCRPSRTRQGQWERRGAQADANFHCLNQAGWQISITSTAEANAYGVGLTVAPPPLPRNCRALLLPALQSRERRLPSAISPSRKTANEVASTAPRPARGSLKHV